MSTLLQMLSQVRIGQDSAIQLWVWIAIAAGLLVIVIPLVFIERFFSLWVRALFAHANISLSEMINMQLRKVNQRVIVLCKIQAVQAGLDITTSDLEAHYLAGGRVKDVVKALIAANRAGIDLTWKNAAILDLAGQDVLNVVQASINPKIIDCPNPVSSGVVAEPHQNKFS